MGNLSEISEEQEEAELRDAFKVNIPVLLVLYEIQSFIYLCDVFVLFLYTIVVLI